MSDLVLGGPPISDVEKTRRETSGLERRTLKDIAFYPEPEEIYEALMNSPGWEYKTRKEFYKVRDRSLICLLYLLAVRVSEVLRLKRDQFILPYEPGGRKDAIVIRGIYLSKRRYKDKPRLNQYREEAFLPMEGRRKNLTMLVLNYLQWMDRDAEERRRHGKRPRKKAGTLFNFKRQRAWQIVVEYIGSTPHWLRAFGETFLYDAWDSDLLAVADYVKVDSRTLGEYIRRGYKRHMKKTGPV